MAVSAMDVITGVVAPDSTGFAQNLAWNASGSGSQSGTTVTPGGNTYKNHE